MRVVCGPHARGLVLLKRAGPLPGSNQTLIASRQELKARTKVHLGLERSYSGAGGSDIGSDEFNIVFVQIDIVPAKFDMQLLEFKMRSARVQTV